MDGGLGRVRASLPVGGRLTRPPAGGEGQHVRRTTDEIPTADSTLPAAVPGAPSRSAGAGAAGIPAPALLQPAEVSGAGPESVPQGEYAHVRPLRPCDDGPYRSDSSRREAVAVKYVVEPR